MNRLTLSSLLPQDDALWRLPRGAVLALPKADVPRRLRLVEGRLWLTEDARSDQEPSEDRWLEPGQSLRLEPGRRVLAEGWPMASFELLEEPRVVTR